MVHRKVIPLLLLTLLTLSTLSAVLPSQTSGDLQIVYSKLDVFQQNQPHNFYFHVFNLTQQIGYPSVSCGFSLINQSGNLVYQNGNITFVGGTGNEFKQNLVAGNFTTLGQYSATIECNSSLQAGFDSVPFEVTGTGIDFTTARSLFYLGLLALLCFLFVLNAIGIIRLPSGNARGEDGNIISISYLKYLNPVLFVIGWGILTAILYISSAIATNYLETGLGDIIFMLFRLSTILIIPALFLYFFWLFINFFNDKKIKKLIDQGMPTKW